MFIHLSIYLFICLCIYLCNCYLFIYSYYVIYVFIPDFFIYISLYLGVYTHFHIKFSGIIPTLGAFFRQLHHLWQARLKLRDIVSLASRATIKQGNLPIWGIGFQGLSKERRFERILFMSNICCQTSRLLGLFIENGCEATNALC